MKRLFCLSIIFILITCSVHATDVQDISKLIEVASNELGYTEAKDGTTKYGQWFGDPTAQWCAEFICWCVAKVDQDYGTQLLNNVYPLYSSRNVGRDWYIYRGRYVDRFGRVPEWGRQCYWEDGSVIKKNSYIPRAGDLMFLGYEGNFNTSHVALVTDTKKTENGYVVNVIEGNNPDKVQRNKYPIDYEHILGYGTAYDDICTTMRVGNSGPIVEQLQKELATIDFLDEKYINGVFDRHTQSAIIKMQERIHHVANAIADYTTQKAIRDKYNRELMYNFYDWIVED